MKKTILLRNCFLLFVVLPASALAQDNSMYISRIDSLVQAKYNEGMFNGSILVKKGNEIIYKKALGWADYEAKDTLKLTTPTRLASVTKSLTAVSILKLVEEGKIDLHEDIHTYLPEIPKMGITTHHLLSHTSGIRYVKHYSTKLFKVVKSDGDKTRYLNRHVLSFLGGDDFQLNLEPGATYSYSNIGYQVLGSLIERVSQISYGEYLKQNIFDPLGMINSFLFIPATYEKDNIQRAYSYKFGKKIDKQLSYYSYDKKGKMVFANTIYGDKHVYSTVEDMEKFNTAFIKGEIISPKYLELATTPVKLNSGDRNKKGYGYGFKMEKSENQQNVIRHTGSIAYFETMNMMIDQKYQIILLQSIQGAYWELVNGCHDILENKNLTAVEPSKKNIKATKIFNESYKIDY